MLLVRAIIAWSKGSILIAAYVAPLIVCGAAIIIIKLMKQAKENDNDNAIIKLFVMHALLFVIGIFTILNKGV